MQNQPVGEEVQRCWCCVCVLARQFLLLFSVSTCSSYRNVCSDNSPVREGWELRVGTHKSGLIPRAKQYLLEEADPALVWLL